LAQHLTTERATARDTETVARIAQADAGYGERAVLHGISLALYPHEVFALLGPNGAGKSTLIRLLTNTMTPRAGTVSADSRSIGLVPQDIALYPWLTPRENCLAFAGLDGLPRGTARTRVQEALSTTRCDEIADIPVARLSGGYQRRANIAVALMRNPALLILDEPTAGLDAEAKRVICDIILGVRARGAGVLLVSHELDLIDVVADRVGVLIAGRFVANDAVAALMTTTFAQSRIVEIVLEGDPTDADITTLQRQGAITGSVARAWILKRPRDAGNADALLGELTALGLRVREMRFREPTVADAYHALTRDAAA
jgi:ABC-2 type transport system ATP-binding protein